MITITTLPAKDASKDVVAGSSISVRSRHLLFGKILLGIFLFLLPGKQTVWADAPNPQYNTTITWRSTSGTESQTVCAGSPIMDIIWDVGEAFSVYDFTLTFSGSLGTLTRSYTTNGISGVLTLSGVPGSTGTYTLTAVGGGTRGEETGGGGISVSGTLTVTPGVPVTSAISGPVTVCAGATSMAYSVTNNAGNTYAWTISGGTQTSGTNTNSITVDWGSPGTGNVSVIETNAAGCSGSPVNLAVTIFEVLPVTCPYGFQVCSNEAPFALTGGSPAGGTYSGPGVSATGQFSPSIAGPGIHSITYTYTDLNGCSGSCSFNIYVIETPVVTCPTNMQVCIDATPFTLTGGSPAGGMYSGPGVSGTGLFSPLAAGVGVHTITYMAGWGDSFTETNSRCLGSCTFTISVYTAQVITCPANMQVCIDATPFALTGGSPAGGMYSGPGVSGTGLFSPLAAGTGLHMITYSFTDGIGCPGSCTFTITVNALPVLTCPVSIQVCSNEAPFALTGGSPAGGTYSGAGVSATGQFSPSIAGPGIHSITYTYTDLNGCSGSCSFNINVIETPVVTCPPNMQVCIDTTPFTLTGGSPAGGMYSGPGVSGTGLFSPLAAGLGVHTITYTAGFGDSFTETNNRCMSSCAFTITVYAAPVVTCPAGLQVCLNQAPFPLTGSNPAGGTYSGPGVSATGLFNPAMAGLGNHIIIYNYTDGNGCPGSCSFSIIVIPAPEVLCPADFQVCIEAAPFALTGGNPAGGVYSGTGVSETGFFNPVIAGAGAHPITYNYFSNGCSASCTYIITVIAAPPVTCPPNIQVCNGEAPFALTGASPDGGTYSGTGVNTAGQFNPAAAGIGTHTITYSYNFSNAGGCTGTCTFTITVVPPPVLTCPPNIYLCIDGAPHTLPAGNPAGGTYSGTGVSAGLFDPAVAGLGVHTITYSLGGTCPATCTFTITVNPSPSVTCPPSFSLCATAAPVTLTGGLPEPGIYTGLGVVDGIFYPAIAGPGTHVITYSQGRACGKTCTFTITVNPMPVVTYTGSFPVCGNVPPFTLVGGLPAGGTYSGPGVSAGVFNPAAANTGENTITYTYTDANGCTSSVNFTITVYATTVTCPQNSTVCIDAPAFTLTGGSPAGGIYSGTGVTATGLFNPAVAGVGTHTITYSQGTTGCITSCTFTITVNPRPVVTCPSGFTVCTGAAPFTLTGGLPAGGIYSGTGVTATGQFNPAAANVGANTITYTYTDANGCNGSCTFIITVNQVTGSISGTASVPQNVATSSPVTFTGGGGQANYTFTYTISVNGGPAGPVQTITTSGSNSVTILQSNALTGIYAYRLLTITDANGCTGSISSPATATILITATSPLLLPDLAISQLFTTLQISAGGTIDEMITIRNLGTGPTTAPIVFSITNYSALTGLSVAAYPNPTIIIGFTSYELDNNNWKMESSASELRFTSNPGVVIPINGFLNLGVRISRINGSKGLVTHTATIVPGTGGGESPDMNNSINNSLLKN